MDPFIGGAAVAGIAVVVIYKLAGSQSRPAKTLGKSRRTGGVSGKIPRRSWLVKAYNSSGATKVAGDRLSDATAELAGRAAGALGRRSKTKWSRRWTAMKTAAARSHDRRQKRWQKIGGPMVASGYRRRPKRTDKPSTPDETIKPAPAPSAQKAPPPKPERHLKAVPDPKTSPGDAVATTDDQTMMDSPTAPEIPPDWALMADRVRNFTPDDDTDLIAFMRGEASGVVAYAEALVEARDNCVNDVGLDPSAVDGFTTYSEYVSDAAERMAEAYRQFVAVYGEIQQLAASGVVLPHNGRFFTGAAS